ncbi:MAG: glycosyltransferase family 4 protein [Chloroflexi bacterium]|nr:glycosyltransferase family 4 protein [Chloroflexota bacterium]
MKILVVVGAYLPGYKGGGPIRSIANLVERMGDEYTFSIVTLDRDVGESQPYSSIKHGEWQPVGKACVRYLTPQQQSLHHWRTLIQTTEHDVLFLNSHFARPTIKLLFLRYLGKIDSHRVILAPRGEFSPHALALKAYKKRPYLALANRWGLYRDVIWRATSEREAEDIRRQVKSANIQVAFDWASGNFPSVTSTHPIEKHAGKLRVVYLSRIVRIKNLALALRLLAPLQGAVEFDIFGPLEDTQYWQECQHVIRDLPANIRVSYRGSVSPEQVPETLARYHLFFLPTFGEGFGRAILEALSVGSPVLISDQTLWHNLDSHHAGWDVPLSRHTQFHTILQYCVSINQSEFDMWSNGARVFAEQFKCEQEATLPDAYRKLFDCNYNR